MTMPYAGQDKSKDHQQHDQHDDDPEDLNDLRRQRNADCAENIDDEINDKRENANIDQQLNKGFQHCRSPLLCFGINLDFHALKPCLDLVA